MSWRDHPDIRRDVPHDPHEVAADQQGTGRPWRGARNNLQKGQK